jgi:predicted ATPase/DNA-binding CsgD family transcriptional regulator
LPDDFARAGVTPREIDIFWLVADRLHNREIADRLVVSVRTVESHVAALLRKLAADNRGDLVALAQRIRRQAGRRRQLPRPLDSFVSRDRELEDLRKLVAEQRMVTLAGPPGAGKTRLALELARSDQTRPPAVLIDLTAVGSHQDPVHVFLDAFAVAHAGPHPRAALIEAVAAEDVWLVVDNCEHVGDIAVLLHELLSATDTLSVLATSQRPLHVAGESVFLVPPLAVPPADVKSAEDLLTWPAARLFVDRASAADPDLDVTGTPEAVAALCRRLDGLPLAIELAAARLRTFTPHELLTRLDDRFTLLDAGGHGRLPRHRTLEAAIGWSYHLLGDIEQRLLQRLSVFAGLFTYDDVVAVFAGSDPSLSDLARVFPQLVDRSLVSQRRAEQATTSYRLLDSIRAFASRCLAGTDPAGATLRRHAEYHLLTAADAGPALQDAAQTRWLDWVERHWTDIRQAMRWALTNGEHSLAWRFVAGIGFGWDVLGIRGEVFGWLDELVAAGLPDDEPVAAAQTAAYLFQFQDTPRALELAEHAIMLADRQGSPVLRARARIAFGWVDTRPVTSSLAATELRRALELLPEHSHTWDRAFALQGLARVTPQLESALAHFARAAELFASIGDSVKHANVLYMMADACLAQSKRLDDARGWLTHAQRLALAVGSHHEQLHVAAQLARLDQLQGARDAAGERLRQLLGAFRRIGDRRCVTRCLLWLGELELERYATEHATRLLTECVSIATDIHATQHAAAGLRRLAQAAHQQGRHAEAAQLLQKAGELVPTDVGA